MTNRWTEATGTDLKTEVSLALYEGLVEIDGDEAQVTCSCLSVHRLMFNRPQVAYCSCGMAYAVGFADLEHGLVYTFRWGTDTALSWFS